jgi:hypothetical protein
MLSLLAEKNQLFFVEYPFTVKDVLLCLSRKTKKAQVGRMLGLKKRIKTKNR